MRIWDLLADRIYLSTKVSPIPSFWLNWPHRFRQRHPVWDLRCARCGVPLKIHRHFEE